MAILGVIGAAPAVPAASLPQYAYREHILTVADAAGKPIAGAQVYGWCRDYNLLWPRVRGHDATGSGEGTSWGEPLLAKTGADGTVKVVVPPGRWGFVATAQSASQDIIAVWSDSRVRAPGEPILLKPAVAHHWTLCSPDGAAVKPKQLYLRPEAFPVWIFAAIPQASSPQTVQMSAGKTQLWGEGDPSEATPGFVLSWGTVGDGVPDGKLTPAEKTAAIQVEGGSGRTRLSWSRRYNLGLLGDLDCAAGSRVIVSPGEFAISYRRRLTPALTGEFAPQAHALASGSVLTLNLGGPLSAQLALDRKHENEPLIYARLYIVDSSGHPLADLVDPKGQPARIGAWVTTKDAKRFEAQQIRRPRKPEHIADRGATLFAAKLDNPSQRLGTVWEFSGLEGVVAQARMTPAAQVAVRSRSFEAEIPQTMVPHVQNVLAQADVLLQMMETVTGRQRRASLTTVKIEPGLDVPSGSHTGKLITMYSNFLFVNEPMMNHTFPHELAHNLDMAEGALQETVLNVTRSYGGEQICAQSGKWFFVDRMNGVLNDKEGGPQTGLYLYCYAVGGQPFLRFLLAHEQKLRKRFQRPDPVTMFSDEITAAFLSLALNSDLTSICSCYGLNVQPAQVATAVNGLRSMLAKQP